MLVQKYLREKSIELGSQAALSALTDEFAIRTALHPNGDPLVILNYSQIDSSKRHPLVQECRGLTLHLETWDVVARSFPRFFNYGECPDQDKKFDWNNFSAETKEDGSLILLYRFNNEWRVNTRGSFGLGEICPGVGKCWSKSFMRPFMKSDLTGSHSSLGLTVEHSCSNSVRLTTRS